MEEKERKILFMLLKNLLEEAVTYWGGGLYEPFGTSETINEMIDRLNEEFTLSSREKG